MKKYLLALLTPLLLPSPAWAAPLPGGDSNLPVDVTADNMEYSSDNKTVVFHGSVEAVRGEFKMWSDKLILVLKGKGNKDEKAGKKKAGAVGSGIKLNKNVLDMMGGFTVLRMTSMVGMVGISFTKEDLLKLNAQLNKTKKPKA